MPRQPKHISIRRDYAAYLLEINPPIQGLMTEAESQRRIVAAVHRWHREALLFKPRRKMHYYPKGRS